MEENGFLKNNVYGSAAKMCLVYWHAPNRKCPNGLYSALQIVTAPLFFIFFYHAGLERSVLKYNQMCTDTLGIFTYTHTHKYITHNFYISFEALPYPLQEI